MATTLRTYLDARSMPEPNSGCQLWTAGLFDVGYGAVYWEKKMQKAHRLSWRDAHGPIPPGMFVCHKCDVRSCINPDHLFLGTNADNVADMLAKGRSNRTLTPETALAIFKALGTGQEIAQQFNVSAATVSHIRSKKFWRSIH